jgi:DNA helicase-2/ATP-dependent DNA helicase PcrA
MGDQLRQQAEYAARLLLQRYREACPSWQDDRAPVDELAIWLGLDTAAFQPEDYPPGTYGFVDPDEDEHLIWLCSGLSEPLYRFTLAHELGHAVLHCRGGKRVEALQRELGLVLPRHLATPGYTRDPMPTREDPCYGSDIQIDMTAYAEQELFQDWLGIGHSYDPRSQHELMANAFAAELLMPQERIRTLYLQERVAPHSLADRFAVSMPALLNRLAGLLKDGAWQEEGLVREDAKPQNVGATGAKKSYDEFQQAAITASTPALITAGPGSGKTSTLIGRVEYLVHTLAIHPTRILALTFSRKAAQEMEERLRFVLPDSPLPKVSTFHAFCADLLRQYGDLVGLRPDFAPVDEAEGYFMLRQLLQRIPLHHYQSLLAPTYYFPDLLKAISRAKDELVSPDDYMRLAQAMLAAAQDEEARVKAERAMEVAQVYQLYEEALQRRGDTDFGGLLVLTVQLLRQHPEVLQEQQELYQHILVDEFQDMNRASGVLLRELAGSARRVWVVGDPNQAIYGFRGASPANISKFAEDFPGAVVLPLSRNYRSRPDLVRLAEAFRCKQLELGEEPGKNQPVRLTESMAYVTLATASDEENEIAGLIRDIRAKRELGYTYNGMVVLCRTRTQAQKISRAFANAGLPVVERGGLLEQEHIKDVLAIVLLYADKSGMGLLRASRQREHALSYQDIEALLLIAYEKKVAPVELLLRDELPSTISTDGRRSLQRLAEMLRPRPSITDMWSLLAQYLLIETSLIRDLVPGNAQDKTRQKLLGDYNTLLQLARHYDQQYLARVQSQHNEQNAQNLQAALLDMSQRARGFLEYLSLLVTLRQDSGDRSQNSDEQDESADVLRVMTVHASKGLEFPIVYMPGLAQRRFPAQAHANPVPPPTGMLLPEAEGSAAHESGESCLFYVGVTRARDHLVLSHSERYGKLNYKRSPYLDTLQAGLPDERITTLRWEKGATIDDLAKAISPAYSSPSKDFLQAMKPPTLTATAIEAYLRCPRQYAYATIYHFTGEEHAYRLFWQATHRTVEDLHKRISAVQQSKTAEKQMPTLEEVRELYTQHWQILGGPDASFAAMYEQHGLEVVETVWHDLVNNFDREWHMRQDCAVDIAGRTVHVTVDRMERSMQAGAPIKFVRTRFGKRKERPTPEVRDMLYARLYRLLHPGQKVELHSHNMSTGEVVPITLTSKKEQNLYDELEQGIQGLERDEYSPTPAEPARCPTCPFFFICPA